MFPSCCWSLQAFLDPHILIDFNFSCLSFFTDQASIVCWVEEVRTGIYNLYYQFYWENIHSLENIWTVSSCEYLICRLSCLHLLRPLWGVSFIFYSLVWFSVLIDICISDHSCIKTWMNNPSHRLLDHFGNVLLRKHNLCIHERY